MLKNSMRFRHRKYLKLEMTKKRNLKLFSIVRVRKFTKKEIFSKEAYGNLSSNMFIIIGVVKNDFITSYKLGCLYDLKPAFECTFTFHEVIHVPLSYPFAVYHETMNNPGAIIKKVGSDVIFKPEHSKNSYIATNRMFT